MNDSSAISPAASPITEKGRAASVMSTPTRNSIAKVAARSNDPYFDRIEIDRSNIVSGVELVKYKEIGELEVDVEVQAFLRVVSVTLLEGPKWVGTSAFGRSDVFRQ